MALNPDRTPTERVPGPKCVTCITLGAMEDSDQSTLQRWLDTEALTASELSEWLKQDAGIYLSEQSIRRHRKGKCSGVRRGSV